MTFLEIVLVNECSKQNVPYGNTKHILNRTLAIPGENIVHSRWEQSTLQAFQVLKHSVSHEWNHSLYDLMAAIYNWPWLDDANSRTIMSPGSSLTSWPISRLSVKISMSSSMSSSVSLLLSLMSPSSSSEEEEDGGLPSDSGWQWKGQRWECWLIGVYFNR